MEQVDEGKGYYTLNGSGDSEGIVLWLNFYRVEGTENLARSTDHNKLAEISV
jgi:hypothetical protein